MKPSLHSLYDERVTQECERVLVSLLRGLGPWRQSVFLVGGLVPRYIVSARPPAVPKHAGTGDIDVLVDLTLLADTNAYATLETNLKRLGFERGTNDAGKTVNWRWMVKTETGAVILLEFIADDGGEGGKVRELPTKGNVSALHIPHAQMVFDLHEKREVTAKLIGGNGVATETIAYANRVSFICLKAFAFNDRAERKDAHDLLYCLEHGEAGVDGAIEAFKTALAGQHSATIREAFSILEKRFLDDDTTEGYLKDGPASAAQFEIEGDGEDATQARLLRQRNASELVRRLFSGVAGGQ